MSWKTVVLRSGRAAYATGEAIILDELWRLLTGREAWTDCVKRQGRVRVTVASVRGRFRLERASYPQWYFVRDMKRNIPARACRKQLRRVLAPLPVRLGMRYNVTVLPL